MSNSQRATANDTAVALPYSKSAEQAVLGTILSHSDALAVAGEILSPADFYISQNTRIFARMLELQRQGIPADVVTVLESLTKSNATADDESYLLQLLGEQDGSSHISFYCKIIREKAVLRGAIHAAESIQQQALAADEDAGVILDRADAMIQKLRTAARQPSASESQLGSLSTAELFAAQETEIDWLAWPFAAVGLSSILDALPKLGKTRFLLEGIYASRYPNSFLNVRTQPMRVVYLSEQSAASLAMQAHEVGFSGLEPIEELRWITREYWSRYIFTDFLEKLEKHFLEKGNYNALVCDTWHTIARLEDEKDASEVNRLGNLTIDVATRNKLALSLGRHDRKSGGDVGVSGRSSIQLSGLVDVILHLVRVPNQPTQRKLELLGRVPGLPNEQLIELIDNRYINLGQPQPAPAHVADRVALVAEWLDEEPHLSGEQIVARFAASIPAVKISLSTANRYKADARAQKGA